MSPVLRLPDEEAPDDEAHPGDADTTLQPLHLLLVIFTQSSTNRRGPAARADSSGGGKGGEAVHERGSRHSREPSACGDKPSPSSMRVRWGEVVPRLRRWQEPMHP